MTQQRVAAIDILKFLAVFLVMNSHMEICYPKFQFLATGGAIGDALFFFASGFTLFLGRDMRFDQWYKRRINRIYPSILAAAIFAYVVWHFEENIGDILIGKRYWFIGCIMIYYIFLYPIKRIKNERLVNYLFVGWLVLMVIAFFVVWGGNASLYAKGLYRCLIFFLFMLQGAIMGKHANNFICTWWHFPLFLISAVVWFYLVRVGTGRSEIIFSIVPLLCITYCLYCICNAALFEKIYNNRFVGAIIYVISQLCLEVYLVQKFVFTDSLNNLFPLNIVVIMLVVIATAYLVKMLAEIISQTFKTEPYDWKKIILWRR